MGRPETKEHSQPDAQTCNGPAGLELCCFIHCKHSRTTRFFFFSGHVHEPEIFFFETHEPEFQMASDVKNSTNIFFLPRRVLTVSANNTQRTKCCRTEDARSVTNGFRFRSVSDLHSLARDSETIKNACHSFFFWIIKCLSQFNACYGSGSSATWPNLLCF